MRRDVIEGPSCARASAGCGLSETIEARTTPLSAYGRSGRRFGMTEKKRPAKGDFARGERTTPPPDEEPDFARGERTTDD
jgi:hypothetical protein